MNEITKILDSVSNHEIDVSKALVEINNINSTSIACTKNEITTINSEQSLEIPNNKRARRIKIIIQAHDNEENKDININLPSLSLKFIKRLGMFGIKIALKFTKSSDVKLSDDMVKSILSAFDTLMLLPPFEIIDIDAKDAKIHIYTL